MENLLKNRNVMILILLILMQGCVTSRYKVNKSNATGTEIIVSPDRVITECEFIDNYEGDRKDPYGFMIHVLDLQNTVLTVSNASVLEKEDCLDRQKIADRIIQTGQLITILGRGDAESSTIKEEFEYTFKKHGTYNGNGRILNYLAIWNNKGQCYDAYYGKIKPCPFVEK